MTNEAKNGYFQIRHSHSEFKRTLWAILTEYLQKNFFPQQDRVLDLGAGHCYFINQLHASDKHALDIADVSHQYANPEVTVHNKSCEKLTEVFTQPFDIIFASNLFEHLKRKQFEKCLDGITEILRTNGKLIVLQPNFKHAYKKYFDDYTHRTIFTHVSLRDYLKASHFKIQECYPKFLPFSFKQSFDNSIVTSLLPVVLKFYLSLPFKFLGGQMLIVAEKK